MAQNSWPSPDYNTRAVTDSEYEQMAARFSDDGIDGRPSDPAVVTAGAGLSVNVRAGVYGNVRGRAWYSGSTTVNLAIGANASGATRIDRVVLRLDRATWTVRAAVKAGTPGAGAPALSQTLGETGVYEVPVARVTVLAGAAAVSVTREELFIGTRIRPCTASTRNPNPVVGEFGVETDTGRVIMWDGAAWRVIYYDSGEIVLQVLATPTWSVSGESVIEVRNGIAVARFGAFKRVKSTLPSGEESRLPVVIPASCQPHSRWQYPTVYISGADAGRLTIYNRGDAKAGQIALTEHPTMEVGEFIVSTTTSWTV
ncbi:hypothetical protein AB0P07_11725 [Streptomyces sp. NPDC085944]|uniref:hypothetical protein n=1 Tax=Streptomyces sp. NPDC085944 TaxID=3154962 RepID=UPI00341B694A